MTARQRLRNLWRAATSPIRNARKRWRARHVPSWALAPDGQPDVTPLPPDPALDPALDLRRRMFPPLGEYARLRMGNDRAPAEGALIDALNASMRTIPSNYYGSLSLMRCPCGEIVRFTPFDNAADLERNNWTTVEQWYCDAWRVRRWYAEREAPQQQQQEAPPA